MANARQSTRVVERCSPRDFEIPASHAMGHDIQHGCLEHEQPSASGGLVEGRQHLYSTFPLPLLPIIPISWPAGISAETLSKILTVCLPSSSPRLQGSAKLEAVAALTARFRTRTLTASTRRKDMWGSESMSFPLDSVWRAWSPLPPISTSFCALDLGGGLSFTSCTASGAIVRGRSRGEGERESAGFGGRLHAR